MNNLNVVKIHSVGFSSILKKMDDKVDRFKDKCLPRDLKHALQSSLDVTISSSSFNKEAGSQNEFKSRFSEVEKC